MIGCSKSEYSAVKISLQKVVCMLPAVGISFTQTLRGKCALQISSVTITPSEQGKRVTVSRCVLTVTLFGNMGFTKTVTVSRVSL